MPIVGGWSGNDRNGQRWKSRKSSRCSEVVGFSPVGLRLERGVGVGASER
jgi:hypothetical protein